MNEYFTELIPGYMGLAEYRQTHSLLGALTKEGLSVFVPAYLGTEIGFSTNSIIAGVISGLVLYPLCRYMAREI